MSLNKTLNRLFDEIRREAKRNEAFADRLDAVLRAHESGRDVPEELIAQERSAPEALERTPAPTRTLADLGAGAEVRPSASLACEINPVAFYTRDGAEALKAALSELPEGVLTQLLGDHNLDPAGAASGLAKPALVEHIVAQAARRVERDRKLFDY